MIKSSEWVLKAILNRYPYEGRSALTHLLSEEERVRLDAMPSSSIEADGEEPPLLEIIHWSWLLHELQNRPKAEQKLFLTVLPLFAQENLGAALKIRAAAKAELSGIGREFLLRTITESLTGTPVELLPVYFLPPSPLSPLLHIKKQEIIHLIDSLALYDLVAELRQIVETKILKKIYSFLSAEEKQFLRKVTALQTPYSPPRLPLAKWDGTEETLRVLLHKRGLARLAAALSTQHPDFIWYVCHRLDSGRGTSLAKLSESEVAQGVGGAIVRQIEELLKGNAA